MRNIFLMLVTLVFITSTAFGNDLEQEKIHTDQGVILKASELQLDEVSEQKYQFVEVQMESGKFKGKIFNIQNYTSDNIVYSMIVKKGDRVVVSIEEADEELIIGLSDYVRNHMVFYMSILFIILIVLIGKVKGIKAALTLFLTMFLILKVLLPGILKGYDPMMLTIGICTIITVLTLIIIGGFNSKSFSAIIGTLIGVIIAGVLAYFVGYKARLTGLSSEEATMLTYIPQGIKFNFKSLLFSGIIMGALGAVMDVAMSISSSIEEIFKANPQMTKKDLFMSGMNVGKDVMGTMSNTLILAYTGSSIPLLILFMAYESSLVKILNLDIVATEIIRSLAGSIGLVMTIPVTAFTASFLIKNNPTKDTL